MVWFAAIFPTPSLRVALGMRQRGALASAGDSTAVWSRGVIAGPRSATIQIDRPEPWRDVRREHQRRAAPICPGFRDALVRQAIRRPPSSADGEAGHLARAASHKVSGRSHRPGIAQGSSRCRRSRAASARSQWAQPAQAYAVGEGRLPVEDRWRDSSRSTGAAAGAPHGGLGRPAPGRQLSATPPGTFSAIGRITVRRTRAEQPAASIGRRVGELGQTGPRAGKHCVAPGDYRYARAGSNARRQGRSGAKPTERPE